MDAASLFYERLHWGTCILARENRNYKSTLHAGCIGDQAHGDTWRLTHVILPTHVVDEKTISFCQLRNHQFADDVLNRQMTFLNGRHAGAGDRHGKDAEGGQAL